MHNIGFIYKCQIEFEKKINYIVLNYTQVNIFFVSICIIDKI